MVSPESRFRVIEYGGHAVWVVVYQAEVVATALGVFLTSFGPDRRYSGYRTW
jgi:hypothetical protein